MFDAKLISFYNNTQLTPQSYMLGFLSTHFKYVIRISYKVHESFHSVSQYQEQLMYLFKIPHIISLGQKRHDLMKQVNISTTNILNHTMKDIYAPTDLHIPILHRIDFVTKTFIQKDNFEIHLT